MTRNAFKILQLNCNRGRKPHDMLVRLAKKRKGDVLMVSEPNRKVVADGTYQCDPRGDAAIRVFAKDLIRTGKTGADGVTVATIGDISIVSVYISPSISILEFDEALGRVERVLRQLSTDKWIVAGDFNARNSIWASKSTDAKGTLLWDWAAALDLCCLNRGDCPTFERAGAATNIDVTFASSRLAPRCKEWRVLPDTTLSDHNCIEWTVELGSPRREQRRSFKGWRCPPDKRRCVKAAVEMHLQSVKRPCVNRITEALQDACEDCLPRKGSGGRRCEYWWNPEVEARQQESDRARRKVQNSRKRNRGVPDEDLVETSTEAQRNLGEAIDRSKAEAWEKLRKDLDLNPWGAGYAIATGKWSAPPKLPHRDIVDRVVKHLFPDHPKAKYKWIEAPSLSPFTTEELRRAARKLKTGKSGGPDGIPPEVVKAAVETRPHLILDLMNVCLSKGNFPRRWKRGRLVLIPKPGKPEGAPNAYRPLCLLDTLGKLLELLILGRLRAQLQANGTISERQHGFQPGRSTISAGQDMCKHLSDWKDRIPVVILVDVKNAFNSAPWNGILEGLEKAGISPDIRRLLQSYLRDRRLMVESAGGVHIKKVTCGVPQGSILGPTLWNILYNGVLELELPEGCEATGYADDLGIKVEARTAEDLKVKAEDAFERVARWFRRNHIELEPTKTEVLMTCGRRPIPPQTFRLESTRVTTKRCAKYLGVWLNKAGNFTDHAREQAARANKKTGLLTGLLANVGGPLPARRKIICGAVTSVLLYGAPLWAGRMLPSHIAPMESAQRSLALRIASAYRTVSKEAALVIAGTPPIRLMAEKAWKVWQGLPEPDAEAELQREWQTEWEAATRGAWTRRLIPTIDVWRRRGEGDVGYHLTQVLSGHGSFASYLHRFKRRETAECGLCKDENGTPREDNPEHRIFKCERWRAEREKCYRATGVLTPETLVPAMIGAPTAWQAVEELARCILVD